MNTTPAADTMREKLRAMNIVPGHLAALMIYLERALDEAREDVADLIGSSGR